MFIFIFVKSYLCLLLTSFCEYGIKMFYIFVCLYFISEYPDIELPQIIENCWLVLFIANICTSTFSHVFSNDLMLTHERKEAI